MSSEGAAKGLWRSSPWLGLSFPFPRQWGNREHYEIILNLTSKTNMVSFGTVRYNFSSTLLQACLYEKVRPSHLYVTPQSFFIAHKLTLKFETSKGDSPDFLGGWLTYWILGWHRFTNHAGFKCTFKKISSTHCTVCHCPRVSLRPRFLSVTHLPLSPPPFPSGYCHTVFSVYVFIYIVTIFS